MLNRRLLIFIFATVFLLVIAWFAQPPKKESYGKIGTFEDCAAAGFKILQSYPRQCTTPDGRLFFETVIETK